MLTVEGRTSRGEVLLRVVAHPSFNPVLFEVDPVRFPLLAGIDPYDDTFFNSLQVKRLLLEIDSYDTNRGEWEVFLPEFLAVCREVLARPHRFLRFVGD
ncbi:hypothetical protein ACPPVO_05735 [Dactylosporangium sp. McL0621]|uniref:hypothetical protein n=1 Tax=Dactylosporangium sp. McL0621 TaxID=3415678 RepID=UPI003CF89F79